MSRAFATALCHALPGAELSHPFGKTPEDHDIWKVGGKIFAAMSVDTDGVSVKCADVATADMLKEAGVAEKAPISTNPGCVSRSGRVKTNFATGLNALMGLSANP